MYDHFPVGDREKKMVPLMRYFFKIIWSLSTSHLEYNLYTAVTLKATVALSPITGSFVGIFSP